MVDGNKDSLRVVTVVVMFDLSRVSSLS
jgi:hypothetical protein